MINQLPSPECPLGYTTRQLEQILTPQRLESFWEWFTGQTGAICDGRLYNHEIKAYEPSPCAANPHGMVVYRSDFERFLAGLGDAEWVGA